MLYEKSKSSELKKADRIFHLVERKNGECIFDAHYIKCRDTAFKVTYMFLRDGESPERFKINTAKQLARLYNLRFNDEK